MPAQPPRAQPSASPWLRLAPAGVVLAALLLYLPTLAPDLLWGGGDFATFQTRAALGEFIDEGGVFDHPLWVILAHPITKIPIRNPAWRANLASALFASLALGLVYLSCRRLCRSWVACLLATGALAVSHTFWTYAVMPKVYSLNALLLASCLYLLLRWRDTERDGWLYAAAWLYGVSFLNHLVMATFAPGLVALIMYRLWGRPARQALIRLALAALAFGLGAAPYLAMVVGTGQASDTGGALLGFAGGLQYLVAHPLALLKGLGWGAALGIYQFPLAFPLGILGLALLWRRDRGVGLLFGLGMLGALLFMLAATDPRAGGVYVWNLHYYLQGYVLFAPLVAIGLETLWARHDAKRTLVRVVLIVAILVTPVAAYLVAPPLARAILPGVPDFRPLPGRDNFVYVLSPWKQSERGARPYGESILAALPRGSVLFADYSIWAIARYLQQVEGQRLDVTLVRLRGLGDQVDLIAAHAGQGEPFLADIYHYYDLEGIQARYVLEPVGPIYRLVPR